MISVNDVKSYVISVVGIGNIVENVISTIENKDLKVFAHLKMVSYRERAASNYCRSASETNKFLAEKIQTINEYPKEKVIRDVIDSSTYPKYRVASNAKSESLNLWIKSDYVHIGLID